MLVRAVGCRHICQMRRLQTTLALCFILAAGSASAQQLPIGQNLAADGWKILAFDGIPMSHFEGTADGVLEVRSTKSSSVLYRAVDGNPKAATLSWSWQVVNALPATDLTRKEGDDRVLAMHVVFADDGFLARLKGMASPFARGHVLTYVWGGSSVAAFRHPHLPDKGWMIVRRPASTPSGVWLDESVDLDADYRRAFGEAPPPVAYIGVSGDSDALATSCFGKVRNIRFN